MPQTLRSSLAHLHLGRLLDRQYHIFLPTSLVIHLRPHQVFLRIMDLRLLKELQ